MRKRPKTQHILCIGYFSGLLLDSLYTRWPLYPVHFLVLAGWTLFCLQNRLHSWWHGFNKVLQTFLRDFWSILTRQRHSLAADLSAAHPRWQPPVPPRRTEPPCWTEIWWLRTGRLSYSELTRHVQESGVRPFQLVVYARL